MGDPRRLHKRYKRPKHIFEKARIEEEKEILKKYGLKNMREIWKAETEINRIRNQAKKLILKPESQEEFFNRLIKIGLIKKGATIDDVLALTKEQLLERRLQTILFKKGLAKTIKEARQLITHKKVKIGENIVNIPSYIVKINEEDKISLIQKKEKHERKEKQPEATETREEIEV
ncbi:MAG: 30S ribosomal protein S4 [Candidatus Pacearchaeota archaeon]|nr:30S ribosomal protein S4 [Candidatus Pacearchaeota archaeon]